MMKLSIGVKSVLAVQMFTELLTSRFFNVSRFPSWIVRLNS